MLGTDKQVRSCNVLSDSRRRLATPLARSMGTLVNGDTTSKETSPSYNCNNCVVMNPGNSAEFRTDEEFSTKGPKTFVRYFERL